MSDFERALEAELLAAARRRTVAARRRRRTPTLFLATALAGAVAAVRRRAGARGDRHRHAFRDHGPAVLGAGVPPRRRFLHLRPLLLPQPMKQLLPLAAAGLVLAACGGVPGNSVATVDGEPIAKTDYDHWNTVVRKLSPGIKPDDARNQALQVLVSFRWVDGEAERLGVKVSDADVKKSFAEQKQQAFPKEADYEKFLKDTTQTEADIVARVRVDLLGQKIQEQVVKGNGQGLRQGDRRLLRQEQDALRAAGEAGPARGADQEQGARPSKAHAALERGDSWTKVAKRYSIDDTSKATGGKLPAQAEGTLDADLDKAVFSGRAGRARRPGQDPVRLLRLHRHERHRARRSRRSPRPRRRSSRRSPPRTSRRRSPPSPRSSPSAGARRPSAPRATRRPTARTGRRRPHTDAAYVITYGCMPPREWNAASYDRMSDPQLAMARDVMDRLDLRGDERVLDAGCGTGRVTEELLARVPNGTLIAVDGSQAMVDQTRERLGDRVEAFAVDLRRAARSPSRSTRSSRPRPSTGSPTTSGCSRAWPPRCGRAASSSPSAAAPGTSPTCRRRSTPSTTRRFRGWAGPWNFATPEQTTRAADRGGLRRHLDLAAALAGRPAEPARVLRDRDPRHPPRAPAGRGPRRVRRGRARAARRAGARELRAAEHPRPAT